MVFPTPTLHPLDEVDESTLKYAVICARYQDKWIFCRHKARNTWELPGGHIDPGETALEAARRELFEETGATDSEIIPVGIYKLFDYGMLCFAEIKSLGPIPEYSEIGQICLFQSVPDPLTYEKVYDQLLDWVQECLSNQPSV